MKLLVQLLVVCASFIHATSLRSAIASKLASIPFEDTNLANYGSQEHIDIREAIAQQEVAFNGTGTVVGLEIWRVENKRAVNDSVGPSFGIKRWPKELYGNFYSGDSYLVLNTYANPTSGKLQYDLHFWLGTLSTIDEVGVAAYKTVELDDFLHGAAIQHREVQSFESTLFLSYFPNGLVYLEGGIESGFREASPEQYVPRLFQIRKIGSTIRAFEVAVKATNLNDGDVFILDAGVTIYQFEGTSASPFEKMKASTMVFNMVAARNGKSKSVIGADDQFWKLLNGSIADVQPAIPDGAALPVDIGSKPALFQLSDQTGSLAFTKLAEGSPFAKALLTTNDVFIVDAQVEVFVWIGSLANLNEKANAMLVAVNYLKTSGKPLTLPITVIHETSAPSGSFTALFV